MTPAEPQPAPAAPPATPRQGRLMTVDQACAYLGISRNTFYRLVRQGQLRPTRVGCRLRLSAREIERYLDRMTLKPR